MNKRAVVWPGAENWLVELHELLELLERRGISYDKLPRCCPLAEHVVSSKNLPIDQRSKMPATSTPLCCEIEVHPGEKLSLPKAIVDRVGPGHWRITIQRAEESGASLPVHSHSAFLSGYAAEDEGLYDDYSAR